MKNSRKAATFGRVGDREGVDRRQEEEIVARAKTPRCRERATASRPKRTATATIAVREQQIDVLDAEPVAGSAVPMPSATTTASSSKARCGTAGRSRAPRRCRCVFVAGSGSPAIASSPAMTWTLIFAGPPTRSCTTEPCRISNQRDRVDLPMTIWVTLLAVREVDHVVGDAACRRRER